MFQTVCQDTDLDVVKTVEDIEESTEAEQDEILLESACDIIPKYGKSLNPVDFAQYFRNILQLLSLRTVSLVYLKVFHSCNMKFIVSDEASKYISKIFLIWYTGRMYVLHRYLC